MSMINDFIETGKQLVKKPTVMLGLAAGMAFGGEAVAQSDTGYNQGAKHGNFFYVGTGVEASTSPYKAGAYVGVGGEVTLTDNGMIGMGGGYRVYANDPNTISVNGRYRFPNWGGGVTQGAFQLTRIPSRVHGEGILQTRPDKQIGVSLRPGLDIYPGNAGVNLLNMANPYLEGRVHADILPKKRPFNLRVEAYANVTQYNRGFFNTYFNQLDVNPTATTFGVSAKFTFHGRGERQPNNPQFAPPERKPNYYYDGGTRQPTYRNKVPGVN